MPSNAPLVTAIAVCYNHARFVIDCLESIRQQTYRPIELIIMDDCSSDDSVRLIRQWLSSGAMDGRLVAHERNQGLCRTLNDALALATGKYVAIVATDDLWMPKKLETQVQRLESLGENYGVVYSDAWLIDESGQRMSGMFIGSHRAFPRMPEGSIFSVLMGGNFIPAMTTLVRRDCYARVGLYDENLAYEDWDMWLRLSRDYAFAFSSEVSAAYRIVSTSLIRVLSNADNPLRWTTDFAIAMKWLSRREEVKSSDALYWQARTALDELYRLKYRAGRHYALALFAASRGRRKLSALLLWLCWNLGVSHTTMNRLLNGANGLWRVRPSAR
jgi:glycosyltransferase involved in cell wall biosynthesis